MRITAVKIRNFRGIKSLDLKLGPVTVLIGENNSGKTSVLDALKLCLRDLGPRRRLVFDALDFQATGGFRLLATVCSEFSEAGQDQGRC